MSINTAMIPLYDMILLSLTDIFHFGYQKDSFIFPNSVYCDSEIEALRRDLFCDVF